MHETFISSGRSSGRRPVPHRGRVSQTVDLAWEVNDVAGRKPRYRDHRRTGDRVIRRGRQPRSFNYFVTAYAAVLRGYDPVLRRSRRVLEAVTPPPAEAGAISSPAQSSPAQSSSAQSSSARSGWRSRLDAPAHAGPCGASPDGRTTAVSVGATPGGWRKVRAPREYGAG